MTGDSPADSNGGKRRTGRTKAKPCRTCKIRKVKCDERQPVCYRCISTGRACGGYGIWERPDPGIVSRNVSDSPPTMACIPVHATPKEIEYFDWFKYRTAIKIPGAFALPFWKTLIFQASMSEPVVWHALMTLSSVHREVIVDGSLLGRDNSRFVEGEQFALQHYNKAIQHLQSHLSSQQKASKRSALVTCIVFVCAEYFRGYFQTAQTHLQNGLRVLEELRGETTCERTSDVVDDWILAAFSRYRLQMELFKYTYTHTCSSFHNLEIEMSVTTFQSIEEAWKQLEWMLNSIFELNELVRQRNFSHETLEDDQSDLIAYQRQLRLDLARWRKAYQTSREHLHNLERSGQTERILRIHHAMASIMVDTCLSPDDESMFDSCTERFICIIKDGIDMYRFGTQYLPKVSLMTRRKHLSRSIVDVGWIAPIYYTALKCRVHRIRLHAVRLFHSVSHREGIYDSRICACVAEALVKIEEDGHFDDLDATDDFQLTSPPSVHDLATPPLPKNFRFEEVEVLLPDGPTENVAVRYRKGQKWKEICVFVSDYGNAPTR
ncbi:hypothetical protein BDV96DRAFT_559749 [Lophiotrema nucula]|uniref:Zn(2)-C6 fungal-type domain-containing protein n=1 Tax=Lophiotrema nucula TaxID=690887 RepID=A0A6A5YH05_9PLEO|nr:hypothetical protein BDV96DRAFT_559749 [Lophiotrema nucula]